MGIISTVKMLLPIKVALPLKKEPLELEEYGLKSYLVGIQDTGQYSEDNKSQHSFNPLFSTSTWPFELALKYITLYSDNKVMSVTSLVYFL